MWSPKIGKETGACAPRFPHFSKLTHHLTIFTQINGYIALTNMLGTIDKNRYEILSCRLHEHIVCVGLFINKSH